MTSERGVLQKTEVPATVDSLQADFSALGVEPGMVLLVHSSLSALGWVCGGPVAVIIALQEVLGSTGTLVMPVHSTGLTDPSRWGSPPVPESWWQTIRETMPAYRPDLTPTRSTGIIAETFRKQKGVLRSAHPHVSFCAFGAHAREITDNHSLAFGMGEASPVARVYDLGGYFFSSALAMTAIRLCISQNIGRLIQPNASYRKAHQCARRVRGPGLPLKTSIWTIQILSASATPL